MRRNDLRGAQEWMVADWLTRSRIVSRLSGRKISGWTRLVNNRVFVGSGAGVAPDALLAGGRLERSRVRFEERLERIEEEEATEGAEEASEEEEEE